jgi:hypothetical protein
MFSDLKFQNFRGFADLQLEGLDRVNLVVGRNNAGKTSFLEGVWMLANPAQVGQMPTLLRPSYGDVNQRYFRWLIRDQSKDSFARVTSEQRAVQIQDSKLPRLSGWAHHWSAAGRACASLNASQSVPCSVVSVLPRTPEQLVKLFASAVSKRGGEEQMDALFRQVDERIRKVRVIPNDDGLHVMFDFNLSEMVPLSQVGQGIHRLLTIFSELVASGAGICIIDEIENGIHHTMLEQVWAGIAAAAATLNVQVFATTHSHECIEAAHAAFSKLESYDLGIVRLFRVEDGVQGSVLQRPQIEAALAGEIDLR